LYSSNFLSLINRTIINKVFHSSTCSKRAFYSVKPLFAWKLWAPSVPPLNSSYFETDGRVYNRYTSSDFLMKAWTPTTTSMRCQCKPIQFFETYKSNNIQMPPEKFQRSIKPNLFTKNKRTGMFLWFYFNCVIHILITGFHAAKYWNFIAKGQAKIHLHIKEWVT
jgi:hypothetical protein